MIHAVGPVWRGGGRGEDDALASCYRRAIELGEANGLASIAFSAISTGVYGFPADRAAAIAVRTTAEALATAPADSPAAFHRVETVLIALGVMLFTIAFMLLHSVWESSKYISKEESLRIIRNYFAD